MFISYLILFSGIPSPTIKWEDEDGNILFPSDRTGENSPQIFSSVVQNFKDDTTTGNKIRRRRYKRRNADYVDRSWRRQLFHDNLTALTSEFPSKLCHSNNDMGIWEMCEDSRLMNISKNHYGNNTSAKRHKIRFHRSRTIRSYHRSASSVTNISRTTLNDPRSTSTNAPLDVHKHTLNPSEESLDGSRTIQTPLNHIIESHRFRRSPLSKLTPPRNAFRHSNRNNLLEEDEIKAGYRKSLDSVVSSTIRLNGTKNIKKLKCSAFNSPKIMPISTTAELEIIGNFILFVVY